MYDRIPWNGRKARCTCRINISSEPEILFYKGLDPRSGSSCSPIPKTNKNMIARLDIPINNIDEDRFLKRPLVPLLIKTNVQRLNRGLAFPRKERPGLIFR